MKLRFLGTRGYIDSRTPLHNMHSSMLISCGRTSVMLDCGEDWLGKIAEIAPRAIVLTHAHPDHAFGLKAGAPCPVYATQQSWDYIASFAVADRQLMPLRQETQIGPMVFEAFPLEHSIRCPAVGYRISGDGVTVFYCPDVVYINDMEPALNKVAIYIGDGATVERSMVRKQGTKLFGHTPIRTQLGWCQKHNVGRAIFTHCGSQIVDGDPQEMAAAVKKLAIERGIDAEIAFDGLEVNLRAKRQRAE